MKVSALQAEQVSQLTGCANDLVILECLRDIDAFELLNLTIPVVPGPASALIDGISVPDDPYTLMATGQVLVKDTMLGLHLLMLFLHNFTYVN